MKISTPRDKQLMFLEQDALWQLLRRTSRIMGKARERELVELGVSADGAAVLFTVLRLGRDATPANIAREMLLEPNSISEQLARMEQDGLLKKAKDREKKNRLRIQITDKGRDIYVKSCERPATRKIIAALSAAEKKQLWAMLAKLRDRTLEHSGSSPDGAYPPSNRAYLPSALSNLRAGIVRKSPTRSSPRERPVQASQAGSQSAEAGSQTKSVSSARSMPSAHPSKPAPAV